MHQNMNVEQKNSKKKKKKDEVEEVAKKSFWTIASTCFFQGCLCLYELIYLFCKHLKRLPENIDSSHSLRHKLSVCTRSHTHSCSREKRQKRSTYKYFEIQQYKHATFFFRRLCRRCNVFPDLFPAVLHPFFVYFEHSLAFFYRTSNYFHTIFLSSRFSRPHFLCLQFSLFKHTFF